MKHTSKLLGKVLFYLVMAAAAYPADKGAGVLFGFADQTGKYILVAPQDPDFRISVPSEITAALGDRSVLLGVKYVRFQKSGPKDSGRQTMVNFSNCAGWLFEVVRGKAGPDSSYCLCSGGAPELKALLSLGGTNGAPTDGTVKERIEKIKNRKVKNAWELARFDSGGPGRVCLVEFQNDGTNLLASLALVCPDRVVFKDYPAVSNDVSAWREGDGGAIGPDEFGVMFAARGKDGMVIGMTWAGEEGENEFLLSESGGALVETGNWYRYWMPE